MSILGTSSFILFFTHCPVGCNVDNQINEPYTKKRNLPKKKSVKSKEQHYTQLIPLDDILNSFK